MFYTIYKITNKINGKVYIGKHQTKNLNDGYMGSGKLLNHAIKKHGIENFEKEILYQFDNESDMNAKESELVTEEFVKQDTNYNLCPGGNGGFGYINTDGLNIDITEQRRRNPKISEIAALKGGDRKKFLMESDPNHRRYCAEAISKGLSKHYKNRCGHFTGKTHTDETKSKIGSANAMHQKGKGNSQHGTMWITDGTKNKKIKKDIDSIPEGWYKGRVLKQH